MTGERIEIWALDGIAEVEPGDDIATMIGAAAQDLRDSDVVVVTSKIVSKAEGRLVPGTRADHLAAETTRVVARRGDTQIVETRHGLVLAAAGIDASNVPDGTVALLPLDPDASARRIRETLRTTRGVDVAVIVSDTMGRPWRDGLVDTAIGAAGIDVLHDLRGKHDGEGHRLEATVIAQADELAAAADLVKGKLRGAPVAVVRGFGFGRDDEGHGARPLVRRAADDMFRLGTQEAMDHVVAASAPVDGAGIDDSHVEELDAAVGRALAALGAGGAPSWHPDRRLLTVDGEPVAAGITIGRTLAALAAQGLRAAIVAAPAGATAALRVVGRC